MSTDRPLRSTRRPTVVARPGFTLIELLVVIAIVGTLSALVLPSVVGVRETANKTECQDKLHQLGIAMRSHEAAQGHLPKDNVKEWGHLAFLLPELDQRTLYDQLQPLTTSRGMLPPAAQTALTTPLPIFWCPSYPEVEEPSLGGESRSTFLGSKVLFGKRMTLSDIIDGESQTLAFGETKNEQPWPRPGLGHVGEGPNQSSSSYGSHHAGGVQIVLCDGSVRFVSDSVDSRTFAALESAQGATLLAATRN